VGQKRKTVQCNPGGEDRKEKANGLRVLQARRHTTNLVDFVEYIDAGDVDAVALDDIDELVGGGVAV